MPESEQQPEPAAPEGPSQPFGAVLVIFFIVCIVAYNGKDSWWGIIPHLLALGFLGWGAWDTFSPATLADILKKYPRETRAHWRTNSLLCTVIFPGVVWLVLGLPCLAAWLKR
jgi:hypothetical protein